MVACTAGVSWFPKVKPLGSTAILELQRVVGTAPGLGLPVFRFKMAP